MRQHLLGDICLPFLSKDVSLALHCSMPSGAPAVVEARRRVRELCLGAGFLPEQMISVIRVIRGVPSLPIPLDTAYVGCGVPSIRLRPSPWCNPYAAGSSTEAAARAHFWAYAGSRADLLQWLLPLAGKVLLAEPGIFGSHAHDLEELVTLIVRIQDETNAHPPLSSQPNLEMYAGIDESIVACDASTLDAAVRVSEEAEADALQYVPLPSVHFETDLDPDTDTAPEPPHKTRKLHPTIITYTSHADCPSSCLPTTCATSRTAKLTANLANSRDRAPLRGSQVLAVSESTRPGVHAACRAGLRSGVVGSPSHDVGGGVILSHRERHTGAQAADLRSPPVMPSEWRELSSLIRSTPGRVCWELFAGTAGLTHAFRNEGWCAAPPVDVITAPAFDLLNPLFLSLVFSIILEGRISVLHLAPPCSAPSQVGNALAEIALRLARAQDRAKGYIQLEQPESSSMLRLPSFRKWLAEVNIFLAVRDICVDGAPWQKPTALVANHECILRCSARCPGCRWHQPLKGYAPDGRPWTEVASPYWPSFARKLASVWAWAKHLPRDRSNAHLAGWASSAAQTVRDVIDETGFTPSCKRSLTVIGNRVSSGIQPVRRALPQLIPPGLSPELHLRIAHTTTHPYLRRPSPTAPVAYAIANSLHGADDSNKQRQDMTASLSALSTALREDEEALLNFVHPFILPVVAKRSLAFMRELSFATCFHDPWLITDIAFGMPAIGWAPHAPTMQIRHAPPEVDISHLLTDADAHNAKILDRTGPSSDRDLDWSAWRKTEEEMSTNVLEGPFFSLQDLPSGTRLLRRFGTWEQHAGATEPTCRLIDDALAGGQNKASGSQFTHRPTDVDSWISQVRCISEHFPNDALEQFASDFAKAYKQVPGDPSLANLATIAQYSPRHKCTVFFRGRTQFFGGKSCPVNFARIPDWGCHMLAICGGLPASHCVDDVLVADRKSTINSGYQLWRHLADLAGWDVPDRKSPLPSAISRVLGVCSDLSPTPSSPPLIRLETDRCDQLTASLTEVAAKKTLSPSLAGKLYGRLSFATCQAYGKFGRAQLRPFSRRQHEPGRFWLNPQLQTSIDFWLEILPKLPPRPMPTALTTKRTVISYSDGEGACGQVGIALWQQGQSIGRAGVVRVPEELRKAWDPNQKEGRFNDIYHVEAIGPLLVLMNFANELADALWLHFVDNDAALSSLVRGGSSVASGDRLTGKTWSQVVEVGCLPWFDRVDSAANPTDGLSRGRLQGPWVLEQIHCPRWV